MLYYDDRIDVSEGTDIMKETKKCIICYYEITNKNYSTTKRITTTKKCIVFWYFLQIYIDLLRNADLSEKMQIFEMVIIQRLVSKFKKINY